MPPQIVEKKIEVPVEVIKTVEVCSEQPEIGPVESPELVLAEDGQSYILVVRRNMNLNFKMSGRLESDKLGWSPAYLRVENGDVFVSYGIRYKQGREIQLLPGPQPEYPPNLYIISWLEHDGGKISFMWK